MFIRAEEKAFKNLLLNYACSSTSSFFFFLSRVKQLEAHQARVENDMHEMDKPLARDKNDQDLDAHLKAVERSEDPMLKYIQKKQTKAKSGLPRKF